MKILKYPHEALSTVCVEVSEFTPELHRVLDQMNQLMGEAKGLGLAANQVGLLQRFFIMRDQNGTLWEFVNPRIVSQDGFQALEEGCLSLPGAYTTVDRAEQITIGAQDRNGNPFKLGAVGIESVCIQHELDHLNGIFYIDKLSRQQRRAILREFVK